MLTLLSITLPVEIIFLTVLRGIGWLKVPSLFIAFSVLFFCCAVSSSQRVLSDTYLLRSSPSHL